MKRILALLPLLAAASCEAATFKSSILFAGNSAGKESETYNADGSVDIEYSFNDRGRGPEIRGHYTLDSRGFPVSVVLSGHDYLKAPVDERLSVKDGEARWNSTTEHGAAPSRGYYISINGPNAETAWIVNALLRATDHKVALLPGGEAHLGRGTQTTLNSAGQNIVVTQFLITGLGFAPVSVWLDNENRFFASPGAWIATIREGWESTNDQLIRLETTGEEVRYRSLAQRLGRHPKKIIIDNVRLFDSTTATTKERQTVWIEGGRISAIKPSAGSIADPDAEIIDGKGQTLMPGLWDMHVHTSAQGGLLNIASGVTSVRDMANDVEMLAKLRPQYDSGEAIGPRIFPCGFIDGRGPYQGPTKVFADTEAEARAAVERYASLGYRQIKVYSSLKPELFPPIVALAHSKGMRVSGHVPNHMTAEQFVREGADEIQHMNFIFLNFMSVDDTRTPARFTAVGEHAAALDQNSQQVTAFIQLLKERKIVIDPTLGVFEGMFTDRPGQVSDSWKPILSRLPVQIQRGATQGGLPAPGDKDQLYRSAFEAMLRMTKRLYDAGVPLVAGTDGLEGLMLHRELEIWVKAGIPAPQVLRLATFGAALVVKMDGELGSIEVGKKADLLLVDGNPAVNISDVRRGRLVIKDGVMYDSAALYRELGIAAQ